MILCVFFFIFLNFFDTTNTSSSMLETFTGLRRNGSKISDEYVEQNMTCAGLIECMIRCRLAADCRTVSYDVLYKKCLLSTLDVTSDRQAYAWLTDDGGWNTYSLKEYTVFMAKPSMLIETLNQANQLCLDRDTVIAGRDDLLYSHSLGFGSGECAWMSDGKTGFIRSHWSSLNICGSSIVNPSVYCILN